MNIMFDTGANQCWIPTAVCSDSDCPNRKFEESKSNTFVDSRDIGQVTYISGDVTGTYATDKFCLSQDFCTKTDFKFLAITQAADLSQLKADGVCGLQPSQETPIAGELVPALYDNGRINRQVFSIHLTDSVSTSFIEFGTPQTNENLFVKIDLANNPSVWSTYLSATNIEGIKSTGLVFDSSATYIHFPDSDMAALFSKMESAAPL